MKTLAATGVTFLLIEAIAASAFGAFEVSAQEKKEAYVPAADVKTLLDKQLPGVEGQQVTILHGAFPAGWVGGMHYHSGSLSLAMPSRMTTRFAAPHKSVPKAKSKHVRHHVGN